jgi:hypothetical protein
MNLWAWGNDLPFVITETITTLEDDQKLKRISNSHRTKRAADVSVIGWNKESIEKFILFFNEEHKDIASISASDLKPRMVVYHDSGHGSHFHIALHSKYSSLQ